jgi:Aromatic-ring-opening dioxygenase LigAB, LigA subunit
MTDYWLSKMFFELQHDPELAKAYRADIAAVIDRYPIKPEVRQALATDDVAKLSPLVNAYLLRFYFQIRGMPEAEFIAKLHAIDTGAKEKVAQGVEHG